MKNKSSRLQNKVIQQTNMHKCFIYKPLKKDGIF